MAFDNTHQGQDTPAPSLDQSNLYRLSNEDFRCHLNEVDRGSKTSRSYRTDAFLADGQGIYRDVKVSIIPGPYCFVFRRVLTTHGPYPRQKVRLVQQVVAETPVSPLPSSKIQGQAVLDLAYSEDGRTIPVVCFILEDRDRNPKVEFFISAWMSTQLEAQAGMFWAGDVVQIPPSNLAPSANQWTNADLQQAALTGPGAAMSYTIGQSPDEMNGVALPLAESSAPVTATSYPMASLQSFSGPNESGRQDVRQGGPGLYPQPTSFTNMARVGGPDHNWSERDGGAGLSDGSFGVGNGDETDTAFAGGQS